MKVYKAEFESGNWCYIFAETEDWAWHYFDKVMYECYSIKSFEEIGKTIAGIVYIYSGVTKNQKLPDKNGKLYICSYEKLDRWYEIVWQRLRFSCWKLTHSIRFFERKTVKEFIELFKENNNHQNQSEYEKGNRSI